MNSRSRRIFQLPKPVSPFVLEPIKAVARCANHELFGPLNFLAGATTRDLVLENMFGRPPGKLTRDLDFGFALPDWKGFDNLRAALLATGRSKPDRAIQRVSYQYSAGISVAVDLIPFGGVQDGSVISWPPNNDFVMNVAGFREALESETPVHRDSLRSGRGFIGHNKGLRESQEVCSAEAPPPRAGACAQTKGLRLFICQNTAFILHPSGRAESRLLPQGCR